MGIERGDVVKQLKDEQVTCRNPGINSATSGFEKHSRCYATFVVYSKPSIAFLQLFLSFGISKGFKSHLFQSFIFHLQKFKQNWITQRHKIKLFLFYSVGS